MEEGRESWQSGGQKKTRMNNLHLAQVGGMEGSPLVYFGKRRRHADFTRFILLHKEIHFMCSIQQFCG